jgi:hypothetical protein
METYQIPFTGDAIVEKLSLIHKGQGPQAISFGDSNNQAVGANSQASGMGTIADADSQTAIGKYNTDESTALFIVGAGTSNDDRKNAFTTGHDESNYYLKVGSTKLTETQLKKILNFIDSIEEN